MKEEEVIKKQISTYLKMQYPKVIFRWDIGADIRLSIGSAMKSKRIHQHEKGYPDLFIAEQKKGFAGFYLEIKKERNEVFLKRGGLRTTEHIKEQYAMLIILRDKGYFANWGLGFEDSKMKIDEYLKH